MEVSNMKAVYRVNERVTVEADGMTVADVFEGVARLASVLGAATKCGCCGSAAILPRVKDAQGFRFHELVCQESKCGATFSFGQHKDVKGSLFPKFSDEHGRPKPNAGWSIYRGRQDEQPTPRPSNNQYQPGGPPRAPR